MHAHQKKFTQRFLANQPWKNPHGENQSERRDFNYFLRQCTGQKNSGKYNLSPPANFFSKSGKFVLSKPANTLFFFFCAKSDANVQHQQAVHLPPKQCQQTGRTATKTGRTSSSKFVPKCRPYTDKPGRTFLEKRAAINEPVPTGRTSNFWAFNADRTVQ